MPKKYIFLAGFLLLAVLCAPAVSLAAVNDAGQKRLNAPADTPPEPPMPGGAEKAVLDNMQKADGSQNAAGVKAMQQTKNQGENRRSRVANAVQAMLAAAENSPGIGEQVREIARSQQRLYQSSEENLDRLKKQNKVMKFLFGPDYSAIKNAKKNLQSQENNLSALKSVIAEAASDENVETIRLQISALESAKEELAKELKWQENSLSLFGWLKKLFVD